MTLEKIKKEWNQELNRIEKAEKLAKTNPKLFEMYIEEFHNICKNMSRLMREYEKVTGEHMGKEEFWRGFH
ncbi:hypothetical protein GCM10008905_31620 [Clostridium malenominatum]|uniref:Uncharacterized protein n=2 Tax=Clostridium malenominatum TaxID=1539 RepID=A0ABN1J6P9_9CLOT